MRDYKKPKNAFNRYVQYQETMYKESSSIQLCYFLIGKCLFMQAILFSTLFLPIFLGIKVLVLIELFIYFKKITGNKYSISVLNSNITDYVDKDLYSQWIIESKLLSESKNSALAEKLALIFKQQLRTLVAAAISNALIYICFYLAPLVSL